MKDQKIIQQTKVHYPTIIGIDPGLRHTGYGIIRKVGHQLQPITWGVINSGQGTLPVRLGRIFLGINQVIRRYQPERAAVEMVFVNVNPQSTLLLGQARGSVIASLVNSHLPVMELTALQIKQGIVGYGRATKTQIRLMVKTLLNLPDDLSGSHSTTFPLMTYDAADALACAIASSFQINQMHQLHTDQEHATRPNPSSSKTSPSQIVSTQQAYLQQTRRRRKSRRWESQPKSISKNS